MTTPTPHVPSASLRALLAGVIDYAGLFPPAALPLEEAIRNYAGYLKDADRWMLGRFICPASRLAELLPYVRELFWKGEPLVVSALGRGGNDAERFVQNLPSDLDAIAAFSTAAEGRALVDVFETRLPASGADKVPQMLDAVEAARAAGLRPFCEIGLDENWRQSFRRMAAPLMMHPGFGCKLRSGGVEASAFPPTEQVAAAISTCAHTGVPMKFTAGLHHPVRHVNAGVNTKMHGFLNVFVACVLARAGGFEEERLREVLEEEDRCAFHFRDYGLSWRSEAVPTEQIESARRDFAISFGSCSFDEPREDLGTLGLL